MEKLGATASQVSRFSSSASRFEAEKLNLKQNAEFTQHSAQSSLANSLDLNLFREREEEPELNTEQ